MRRRWKVVLGFVLATCCIGFAVVEVVIHHGPRQPSDAVNTVKDKQPLSSPALVKQAAPKVPPTSRMPDFDLQSLVKHVDTLCETRLAVLRDSKQSFERRKEAALTLAKLRYFPAIPTLIDNLTLSAHGSFGLTPDDFPCQQAIRQFGDQSFAYLMDGCRKNYPKEQRLALNSLIKQMGWKDYAESVCRSYLELPYDETTLDIINRHLRNFPKEAE